jgi:hypothetical protein
MQSPSGGGTRRGATHEEFPKPSNQPTTIPNTYESEVTSFEAVESEVKTILRCCEMFNGEVTLEITFAESCEGSQCSGSEVTPRFKGIETLSSAMECRIETKSGESDVKQKAEILENPKTSEDGVRSSADAGERKMRRQTTQRTLSLAKSCDVEEIWSREEERLGANRSWFSLVYAFPRYLPLSGILAQLFEIRWRGRGGGQTGDPTILAKIESAIRLGKSSEKRCRKR